MRSQEEDASLCSEVGRRGLLMASGGDPQGFVLDHLKLVQMGGGYFGEQDGGGIIKDGVHDGLICGHQCFSCKAPADQARAFMTLRALEARSTQSLAWGPKVKWLSSVTPRILGALFSGATASSIRLTSMVQSWLALAIASTMLGAEASKLKLSA